MISRTLHLSSCQMYSMMIPVTSCFSHARKWQLHFSYGLGTKKVIQACLWFLMYQVVIVFHFHQVISTQAVTTATQARFGNHHVSQAWDDKIARTLLPSPRLVLQGSMLLVELYCGDVGLPLLAILRHFDTSGCGTSISLRHHQVIESAGLVVKAISVSNHCGILRFETSGAPSMSPMRCLRRINNSRTAMSAA